ncbi:outer membrane beta-barrel protein [Tenacibaculum xiamenense]|uniref:outer membrane beta-barrel protein n=1 Tax=Tenacibaculum xiamenense TaxID=1261553 RepID=UPI0038966785
MKKLVFIIAVMLGVSIQAQEGEFNVGVNAGLPIGDTNNVYSFTLGAEANYLFNVADNFKAGPSVAFVNFFGKDINDNQGFGDIQFLPIAAAARYQASDKFTVGADIGYGVGINTGNDGGFYYRPLVSYEVADNIAVQGSYNGISADGGSVNSIGLGILFKL